jgi:hypothetical protein
MKINYAIKQIFKLSKIEALVSRFNKTNNYVSFEEFGAVGDGLTDDTEAINETIQYSIDNNKSIKSRKGMTYLISSPIQLNNAAEINLSGSVIKSETILNSIFEINSDNVILENINIDCNNTALYGINISEVNHTILKNISISNIFGTGIYSEGNNGIFFNLEMTGVSTTGIGICLKGSYNILNNVLFNNCNISIQSYTDNIFQNIKSYITTDSISNESSVFYLGNGVHHIYTCISKGYEKLINVSQDCSIYVDGVNYIADKSGNILNYSNTNYSNNTTIKNSSFNNTDDSNIVNLYNMNNSEFKGFIDSSNNFTNINKFFCSNEGECSLEEGTVFGSCNYLLRSGNVTQMNIDISIDSSALTDTEFLRVASVPEYFIPRKDVNFLIEGVSVVISSLDGSINIKGTYSENSEFNIFINTIYLN